jgi:hypothetical protein
MKNNWHEFFVVESVQEVVKVFRRHRLQVDYNENISPQGHARGFIEKGFGGMIMDSDVWREGFKTEAQSCIEISAKFKIFKKIRKIIAKDLNVV